MTISSFHIDIDVSIVVICSKSLVCVLMTIPTTRAGGVGRILVSMVVRFSRGGEELGPHFTVGALLKWGQFTCADVLNHIDVWYLG